jgi:hypothetical protein
MHKDLELKTCVLIVLCFDLNCNCRMGLWF